MSRDCFELDWGGSPASNFQCNERFGKFQFCQSRITKLASYDGPRSVMSLRRDLNPRHEDFKTSALPD